MLKPVVHCSVLLVWALAGASQALTITGHVVDSTAMPVAGAEVVGYEWVDGYGAGALFADARATARSDDHGRFTLSTVKTPRYQYLIVAAWKPGLAVGWEMVPRRQVPPDVVIPLARPSCLAGVVTDEHKQVVAGATLRLCLRHERMVLRGLPGVDFRAPLDWFSTQTNAAGRFRFDRIPEGATADLWAEAKGKASIWTYWKGGSEGSRFAAGTQDIQISVGPESRIDGCVTDEVSGRAVPGVRLMARPDARWAGIWRADTVVAGKDGQFSFPGLTAGPYTITMVLPDDRPDEWVAKEAVVELGPGEILRGVSVKAGKGAIIEVAVTDSATKRPVEAMETFVLQPAASAGCDCYEKLVHSNKEGLARFRVPPGRCTISACGNGYRYHELHEPVDAVAGQTYHREIDLERTECLRGTVRDAAGNAVTDVLVVSRITDGLQKTGPSGGYELPWDNAVSDPTAKVPLVARDTGRCRTAMAEFTSNTTSVNLTLQPAYRLVGKVTDPNGRGIPLVSLRLFGETQASGITLGPAVLTDSQGSFEIPAVPPPVAGMRYTMEVRADGFGPAMLREIDGFGDIGHPVAVPAIILEPADQSVSGIVQDANGRPLANIPVYALRDSQPRRETVTDANGGFRLSRVCRGPISLGANYSNSPEGSGMTRAEAPAEGVKIVFGKSLTHVPEISIEGRPLPDLAGLCGDLAQTSVADRAVLVCLVDLEQRPSRHVLSDLAAKTDALAAKDVAVVVIQTSKVDRVQYEAWLKENKRVWPVHAVEGDFEAKKTQWGVKALPWLILADRQHVVRAEGFGVDAIGDRLESIGK